MTPSNIYFYICGGCTHAHVCVYVSVCVSVLVSVSAVCMECPEAGAMAISELPSVCVGNRTWVLWKS